LRIVLGCGVCAGRATVSAACSCRSVVCVTIALPYGEFPASQGCGEFSIRRGAETYNLSRPNPATGTTMARGLQHERLMWVSHSHVQATARDDSDAGHIVALRLMQHPG